MPLLNQGEASRLFSVLNSGRDRSFDSVTAAFSRAFAPSDAVRALTCVVLLLKVPAGAPVTSHSSSDLQTSQHIVRVQEHTVLQLPERLAAHFLLWQAGRDLPLTANPFGPALVEVRLVAEQQHRNHQMQANVHLFNLECECLQTACDSVLPIVERAFILQLLSGTALDQVWLHSMMIDNHEYGNTYMFVIRATSSKVVMTSWR